jgi:hypothetical protein
VTQHLPTGYVFNPDNPRAPTHEQWLTMNPAERERVDAMLPASMPSKQEAEQLRAELEQRTAALGEALAEQTRLREEEQRGREEEQRGREEEHRGREDAERRLAEALAEIARLKKPPE